MPPGISLSSDKKKLVKEALEIIEACRGSQGIRAAYCRQINALIETGRQDGTRSLLNKLYKHVDRLSAHLFSPTDLRFAIDFENEYPAEVLKRGAVIAKILGRDWERKSTDTVFAQGVFESLKYGSCFLKQWVQQEGPEMTPVYYKRLVMPWQFGVYREDVTELALQPAMCETVLMSMPEVWRRIYHLPNAEKLMARIRNHAQRGNVGTEFNSFFHQVLSTSTLNTGNTGMTRPVPGGIVQLNNDPNYAILGPEVGVDLVKFHELWLWDETDYTTVQIVEPDILIAPLYKRSNLLISGDHNTGLQPYTLIQPNEQTGYLWGRSEIQDLIEPQGLLSTWSDDVKRLFGLQIDKILAFSGYDGVAVETYDQMRSAGFFNGPQGAQVNDLTPKFPPEAIPMLQFVIGMMDSLGGFENLMQGKGEQGVRAGVHANTLLKTGSPTLRDRSLLVERQCAEAAHLRVRLMEAKEGRNFWTDGSSVEQMEKTAFLLTDLPEDWRVIVDGHSGSPIFADDHQQLIAFGMKAGFVDPHYAIDNLPYPNKEVLHQSVRESEKKKQAMLQQLQQTDPEGFVKVISGGRRH